MARTLPLLFVIMLFATFLAGCFGGGGGDDNGDADPTTTPTPPPTNNTTAPDPFEDALIPPMPSFMFDVLVDGDNVSAPYFVRPDTNLTVNFDGSASTDEDGTIEIYSWIVTGPGAFEQKATARRSRSASPSSRTSTTASTAPNCASWTTTTS